MRVLVIGCGYVGLALGTELARRGHAVSGLRRGAAAAETLRAAGIAPLQGDISRPETLKTLPDAWDWVVDCVSSSHGGEEDYRAVYLEGARHLLEWLKALPPRKFVYTGSTGVYLQNDGSLVAETSPAEPAEGTARILRETEKVLLQAVSGNAFPAVVLRCAGIYGPGRGYWLQQFLSGQARLQGDGARVLNMIHRDDVVGAILAALERGRAGEIYNVVDNEPVSQRVLFEWLSERLQRPMPGAGAEPSARKRAPASKRISNAKLKTELGWSPRFPSFREGFESL